MEDNIPFVVRPLQSPGLDGAFRVHLSPESLDRLGLRVGEICQISGENGSSGYGIAWRATDKMGTSPKVRPAKMTDTIRTAFGFKEGSQIIIARTTATINYARKITLHDVTPSDSMSVSTELEDGRWNLRCKYILGESEALANGITIEVFKKKGLKKRFFVEHIESRPGQQPGAPALFSVDDDTQIIICEATPAVEPTLQNGDSFPVLDTSRIGGLLEQTRELNRRLDLVLGRSSLAINSLGLNQHILLHGYEGTGKSLLINSLEQHAQTTFKVIRVDSDEMVTSSPSKSRSRIESVFQDAAVAGQPCLILMDDVSHWIQPDSDSLATTLGRALDRTRGTRILCIGTARSFTAVNSRITSAGRLSSQIELPIPDLAARRQILDILISSTEVSEIIAKKTHGFTGSDLASMIETARNHMYQRQALEHDEWVQVHARVSMLDGAINGQADGSVHSQATTEVENATQQLAHVVVDADAEPTPDLVPSTEDFEYALKKVRPTALREVFLETPRIRWSDIGGSEAMKQRFDEIIGWPLQHADLLKQYHVKPQKGVLLYGPPGCSKTLTAQAVATTYDLNFIAVKGAELISMYVGESERAVREVFRKAKHAAPCIIFFDEIDAIGSERDSQKGLHVLTTLLIEMDGFEAMKDVLVLAATNKPENLDPALIRAGRFDSHIYIGPPNVAARKEILAIALRDVPAEGVDVPQLVLDTDGYSGAEMVRLCEVAKGFAIRRRLAGGGQLCQEDFAAAIEHTPKNITADMLRGYEAFATRR